MEPHTLDIDNLTSTLKTDLQEGLSREEADLRIQKYGKNELPSSESISYIKIFIAQFKDLLVAILLVAGIISGIIGYIEDEPDALIDVVAIAIVVGLNAVLGFYQEISAEKAIKSLKSMTVSDVVVIRNGERLKIASENLVPGDLVVLEAGEMVPADIRLIQGYELRTVEGTLTGESLPIKKRNIVLRERIPLGDRLNMLYKGTTIVNGSGTGLVCFTGEDTEIGKIATSLIEIKADETPLQKRLDELAKTLTVAVVVLSLFIVLIGIIFLPQLAITELLILAIGLAVAAIPEGLPAVLTLSLALGITRLARKNSLIRKLPAVEVLGSTTVICSDKTGTLTKNEMTVKMLWTRDNLFNFSGSGYANNGEIVDSKTGQLASVNNFPDLEMALLISSLCNEASLKFIDPKKPFKVFGDPTEVALQVAATKGGRNGIEFIDNIKLDWKREFIFPFDSDRKMMSVIVKNKKSNDRYVFVKGATDILLGRCTKTQINKNLVEFTPEMKSQVLKVSDSYSESFAYRILGLSYKKITETESDTLVLSEDHREAESNLVFLGFIGMIDPPRDQSRSAIETAHKAGINVIMITGDHKETAKAIGKNISLIEKDADEPITGVELDEMSDEELSKKLDSTKIFARVSPNHKLRIVNELKKRNQIVAMTGDGVNDAPALKRADIGIAMGITGTDVAKEASEMVLIKDDFSNIIDAVHEGRVIYDNMKKFIAFLLSANAGEILTILLGIFLGIYFGVALIPVLAIQLLYINLVTDTFPAIALGMDNPEEDIMKRKPRDPDEPLLDGNLLSMIIVSGIVFAFGAMFTFLYAIDFNPSLIEERQHLAHTMAFTSLVIYQLFHAVNASERYSIFKLQTFRNKALLGSILLGLILQLIALYEPIVSRLLDTVPLEVEHWIIILLTCIPVVLVEEIRKKIYYSLDINNKT